MLQSASFYVLCCIPILCYYCFKCVFIIAFYVILLLFPIQEALIFFLRSSLLSHIVQALDNFIIKS